MSKFIRCRADGKTHWVNMELVTQVVHFDDNTIHVRFVNDNGLTVNFNDEGGPELAAFLQRERAD